MTFKVKGGLQVNSTSVVDANGSWTGNTIAIAYGGTGANTALAARSNLGLAIGLDVQAYNIILNNISGLGNPGVDKFIYFNGANTVATSTVTSFSRTLLGSAAASDARTTLGLGTIATQANNNVNITGGSITGITDLAVVDGGTGASTSADARTNLGLVIGTDVQAYHPKLSNFSGLSASADQVAYFTGANTLSTTSFTSFGRSLAATTSASDARTTLGLGSIATQSNTNVNITGGSITGITDLAITDGGTGASTAADARTNLGLAIGTNVQAWDEQLDALASVSAAADKVPYFTSSNTASVATLTTYGRSVISSADSASLRSTLGLGSIATQDSSSVSITGGSITGITDLAVADGGTGASTAADARTNLGLVIGTNVQAYSSTLDAFNSATSGYIVKTSASTVASRAIANGTGVIVTNGTGVSGNTTIAIGQDVSTTANVTFYDVTVNGTLNSNDITSANVTVSGNAVITGNLTVQGTTTTIQSTVIEVGDSIILLNGLETGTPTLDAGLEVKRGISSNVKLIWKEATDRWTFTNDGSNYYNIPVPSEYNNYTYDISAVSVSANTAKLRLNGGGTTDDVSFVGAGTVNVTQTDANTITITGVGSAEFEVTNITSSSASVVDSFVKTTYRSAEYTFTATVTTGTTHYVIGRILVIHNGTSAYNTQYAILSTNANDDLVDFTADVSGSNVRLLAQATSGNVVKVKITGATYSTV
jgi:hypothetical protein